ncbi:MAG TPA: extracellular solute-binding protein, partial [Hyphomicrobiaceae bacterium]|nr:extracellular solute-binding protein [Hyphomicrobiaceae bacterium]
AQQQAILEPLRKQLGFPFKTLACSPSSPHSDQADVVEVDQATLRKGCSSGRFARLGGIALAAGGNGASASDDFIPGALTDCGVGTFAWSSVIVFDVTKFEKREPDSLNDILNTKRYPGKRALIVNPPYLMSMLALATGVARTELYQVLDTRKGADDVFAALEKLRPHIIWVDGSKTAIAMLDSGKATISMSFSGRTFRRAVAGSIKTIWDGHVYDFASWAVPAGSRHTDQARQFIAAATAPALLAAQARQWPYGPMRKSSAALADRHALIDIPLAQHLPTAASRLAQGVIYDAAFWARNEAYYRKRLDAFREGFADGVRVPAPVQAPLRKRT